MDGKKCSFTRPSPAKDAGCLLRRPSAVLCNGKGRGGDPWLEKGKQEGEDRKGRKRETSERERRGAQHLVCESSPQSRERAPAGAVGGRWSKSEDSSWASSGKEREQLTR